MASDKKNIKSEESENVKETCCGCIDIHTGTLIIAILSILSLLSNVNYSTSYIILAAGAVSRIMHCVALVFPLLGIVFAVLLIYGNLKKNHRFYTPYLVYTGSLNILFIALTFLFFLLFVISFFVALETELKKHGDADHLATSISLWLFFYFVSLLITTAISIYFWRVVKRSKNLLMESSNSESV